MGLSWFKGLVEGNSFIRFIRFHEYGPGVALATLLGAFLSSEPLTTDVALLVTFVCLASSFGFTVNDISDIEVDGRNSDTRNPVADGSLSKKRAVAVSAVFVISASLVLLHLPAFQMLLGSVLLLLFFTYSFIVRAKSKPGLDLAYQATPALSVVMGFTLYRPLNLTAIFAFSMALLIGVMAQILQEARDVESDMKVFKTTVSTIGVKTALNLCALLMLLFLAIAHLLVYIALPPKLLVVSPFTAFLVTPFLGAVDGVIPPSRLIEVLRRRGIALALAVLALLILSNFR